MVHGRFPRSKTTIVRESHMPFGGSDQHFTVEPTPLFGIGASRQANTTNHRLPVLQGFRANKVVSSSEGAAHLTASPLRRSSTNLSEVYGRSTSNRGRRSTGDLAEPPASLSAAVPSRASFSGLPQDRVLLSESPSHPDVPLAHRSPEERSANPDRLSLDRRGLMVCPILEGEENLRLLNYQHNVISRIQHLSCLRKLIFLDLYDNRIEVISGLSSLKSLRVLMLGKNRISKIEGLDSLVKLDVLDLHGNEISELTNLSHLIELRVLNLAGNRLTSVRQLCGLNALNELNLRRNRIRQVEDIDMLPAIQRLFLSFNDINSWQNVACLSDATSLVELALDGNPLSRETNYKQTVIHYMPQLRQLDMKRISDEERRMAVAMARKEEEKRRDTSKAAALKEKRRLAITNARRQWESMQASLLARGTLPAGLSIPASSAGGRLGRGPPELFATHVSTVCLPRPQSANSSAATTSREETAASSSTTPHSDEAPPTSRPPSGRLGRPGSARTTIAMATVTALPSGLSAFNPAASGGASGISSPESHFDSATPNSSATLDVTELPKGPLLPHRAAAVTDSGFVSSSKTSLCDNDDSPGTDSRILSETPDSQWSPTKASCHLAEVQGGDQLHLYGAGSVDALDRPWPMHSAGNIHTVKFAFLDFEEIWRHLHKVRVRFPAVQTLVFNNTNIRSLAQLNSLSCLRKLEALTIEPDGNPVAQLTLTRPFLLFRLAQLGLRRVNGVEVRAGEILAAERLFAPLSAMTVAQLAHAKVLTCLSEARKQQQQHATALFPASPDLAAAKLGLNLSPDALGARQESTAARQGLASSLLSGIVEDAVSAEQNRETMARCWPQLFRCIVGRAVEGYLEEID